MKRIVFQAKVSFVDSKGKHIELQTYASTAPELLKNLEEILSEKKKSNLLKLFGF